MNKTYKIAPGKRVYAIGDIHGYPEALMRMHDLIEADKKAHPIDSATIVYLGDYIDRGPDSKGVIDILIAREAAAPQFRHVFLLGNHEDAMINEFLVNPHGHRQDWLQWGGAEAAASYGVHINNSKPYSLQAERVARELLELMPPRHQQFFKKLQLYYIEDDYLFVHAGIRPGVPIENQNKHDLTYTREPFMSYEGHHPYRVVHGHSAVDKADIRPNRINVDTHLYGGGQLTCAVIEGEDVGLIQTR